MAQIYIDPEVFKKISESGNLSQSEKDLYAGFDKFRQEKQVAPRLVDDASKQEAKAKEKALRARLQAYSDEKNKEHLRKSVEIIEQKRNAPVVKKRKKRAPITIGNMPMSRRRKPPKPSGTTLRNGRYIIKPIDSRSSVSKVKTYGVGLDAISDMKSREVTTGGGRRKNKEWNPIHFDSQLQQMKKYLEFYKED